MFPKCELRWHQEGKARPPLTEQNLYTGAARVPGRKAIGRGRIRMHVCENCGASNPVANRVCLKCGAELPDPTK